MRVKSNRSDCHLTVGICRSGRHIPSYYGSNVDLVNYGYVDKLHIYLCRSILLDNYTFNVESYYLV